MAEARRGGSPGVKTQVGFNYSAQPDCFGLGARNESRLATPSNQDVHSGCTRADFTTMGRARVHESAAGHLPCRQSPAEGGRRCALADMAITRPPVRQLPSF